MHHSILKLRTVMISLNSFTMITPRVYQDIQSWYKNGTVVNPQNYIRQLLLWCKFKRRNFCNGQLKLGSQPLYSLEFADYHRSRFRVSKAASHLKCLIDWHVNEKMCTELFLIRKIMPLRFAMIIMSFFMSKSGCKFFWDKPISFQFNKRTIEDKNIINWNCLQVHYYKQLISFKISPL